MAESGRLARAQQRATQSCSGAVAQRMVAHVPACEAARAQSPGARTGTMERHHVEEKAVWLLTAVRTSGVEREHGGDLTSARKVALPSSGCRQRRRPAAGGVLRGERKG
jgi:hypothetical protein